MGGARCSYRTCKVRTDGRTHLFHFPVFEKLRCHQWLTNAQRLYFLNLKLSQLKNKVVCQYHFTDDQFMNYKKDKLKCFAVPTEDGPFCDTSEEPLSESEMLSPIKPEYIENEYPFNVNEKKAKFSMKYGDFLTNCDVMETDNRSNSLMKRSITPKRWVPLRTPKKESKPKPMILASKIVTPTSTSYMNTTLNTHMDTNTQPEEKCNITKSGQDTSSSITDLLKITKSTPSKSKITILSEESFNNQIPIPIDTFVTVSPSMILQAPKGNKKNKDPPADNLHYIISLEPYPQSVIDPAINYDQQGQNIQIVTEANNPAPPIITDSNTAVNPVYVDNVEVNNAATQIEQVIPDLSNKSKDEAANKELNITEEQEVKEINKDPPVSPTIKQNKISNKRVADIEQKRNFNKKLRDIVEESLNRTDESESLLIPPKKPKLQSMEAQDPIIKYLDSRLQQMEYALIKRIDTNSHRIKELKSELKDPRKEESRGPRKYSVFTQTTVQDEQTQKKYLYNDISKYLSAEAKSLVFEELFLKKTIKPPVRSSKRNVKT